MELLVVVVILGILAVVLFTNLKRAIWKAREGRTAEHLQTLRTAVEVFYAQEGPEYNYSPDSTCLSTNGYPYSLTQHPTNSADVNPTGGSWGWSGGEGEATVYIVEQGRYQAGMNTYLNAIPEAEVCRNGDFQMAWDNPDLTFYWNNGMMQVNILSTNATSNPGDGVVNVNHRGFHYRNTDGKVRINNTCYSTEGVRYDSY